MNAEKIEEKWFSPFSLQLVKNSKFSCTFLQNWSNIEKYSDSHKECNINKDDIVPDQADEEGEWKYTEECYKQEQEVVLQDMANPVFLSFCVDMKDVLPE